MNIATLTVWLSGSKRFRDMGWRGRLRIVVFAGPLLLSLAALGFAVEAAIYRARSVPVEGLVVERYEYPGTTIFDAGKTNFEPIFTYRIDGADYRASVGAAHASFDVEKGETAMIRAIPGNRGNVRMDSWQGMWFVPAMLALFAGAAWVGALVLWGLLRVVFFRKA